MWDRIVNMLDWAWENKAEIIAVAGPAATFALIAGGLVKALLEKTPTGDPTEVTDEMIEDLKANWAGVLPASTDLGFPADPEVELIEPDEE